MEVVSLIASKALNECSHPATGAEPDFLYLRCWHLISKEFSLGSLAPECSRPLEALAREQHRRREESGRPSLLQGCACWGDSGVGWGRVGEGYVPQSTAHLGAICAFRITALLRGARNTFRPGGSNGFLLLKILCSLSISTEFPLPFALQILLVKQSLCEFYQTIPTYFVVFFLPGPAEAVAKGKFFLLMHQTDRTHEC